MTSSLCTGSRDNQRYTPSVSSRCRAPIELVSSVSTELAPSTLLVIIPPIITSRNTGKNRNMSVVDRVVRAGLLISGARLYLISLWKVSPLISPLATSMQSAAVPPLGEPSAQDRGDVTFVLRNQLPQIFHLGESEGNGLLVLAEEVRATMVSDLVIGDPGQHTLGIDVIELGRSNQCQHDRGVRAATVTANSHDLRARATPRSSRSAELLPKQMRPASRKRVKTSMSLSM